jgi:hypothetical protein
LEISPGWGVATAAWLSQRVTSVCATARGSDGALAAGGGDVLGLPNAGTRVVSADRSRSDTSADVYDVRCRCRDGP